MDYWLAGVFWLSIGLTVYTYVGYPFIIWTVARLRPKPVMKGSCFPTVSLIIAAYNEERVIKDKLENTLALLYPKDKLEIVLVADGSVDNTVTIAETFRPKGIRVLYEPQRRGKTAALNRAVEVSNGEILLFSDANTVYSEGVIDALVKNFHDPTVGGVSGRKIILQDAKRVASQGETAFWSYEASLKKWESLAGSIVTADGEIFSVRKSLFEPIPQKVVHDDMYLTLTLIKKGYRVVYESDATSGEHASKHLLDEFHLKVRYASAGYQIVSFFRTMLIPPRTLFAFEFLSHKLFRWLAPVFIVTVFISSAFLSAPFYQFAFWTQVLFFVLAAVGWKTIGSSRFGMLYFPLYFCMGNLAAAYGLVRYFSSGQSTLWRKAER